MNRDFLNIFGLYLKKMGMLFSVLSLSFSLSGCNGSSSAAAIDAAIGLIGGSGPVLSAVPAQTVQQTQGLLVDINNVKDGSPGSDADMSYLCHFDRTVDGSVSSSAQLCSTLPGTSFSFGSGTGKFEWTPSTSELGDYEVKITGTNKDGSDNRIFTVSVRLFFAGLQSITNVQGDRMDLNWTANPSASGYQILKKNTDGTFSLYQTVTNGAANGVTLTGLTPLQTYAWRVSAIDSLGQQDGNQVSLSAVTSDLVRLEITSAVAQLSPGQSTTVTCRFKDQANNYLTTAGLAVTFSNDGTGTSAGTFSATNDLGNGTYTATFTATSPGTLTNITASIPQYHSVQTKAAMTVSPLRIEILTSQATLNPGETVNLTAKIRDFAGNLMSSGGHALTFTYAGGTGTGTFGAVTDNGNGTYSGTFTGGAAGTAITLGANISTTSQIYSTASLTVSPFSLEVTSALSDVSLTRTTTVTGRLKDWQGNYIATGGKGLTLAISGVAGIATIGATTDVGDGTYTATLIGVSLGSIGVTGSISQSYTVTLMPTITIRKLRLEFLTSDANLMPGQVANLTARVKDWQLNVVGVGGHGLTMATTGGSSTGTVSSVTDNNNGTYSATFTAGSAGTAVNITGTINDAYQVDTSPTITVHKWRVYVTASSTTVSAGQTVTLTATIKNYLDVQAATGGQSVFFSFSGGTSSGTIGSVTDNGNGTYTATYTALTPGTALTVNASLAQSYDVIQTASLTVEAIKLALSVSQSSVNPSGTLTVSAQVQTAAGVNLTTGSYTIGFSYASGTSTGTFSAATNAGNGLYTATFTGAAAGTAVTLQANANVSYMIAASPPTFTVVPWKIELTAAASTVTVGQTTTVTARIKDWQNNFLTSGGMGTGISLVTAGVGSVSSVTDNNDGTYTATFTASGVGSTAVTGSLVPSYTVTVSPTITVEAVHLALTAVQTSLNPADGITIQAQVKDGNGNNLTTGAYTIGFSYSGGTSTGTFGSTTALGLGLYSVQFTGGVAGTAINVSANANMTYTVDNTVAITVVPWKIEITASKSAYVINETGTLTARIKDWQNNFLTAGGKSLSMSLNTAGIGTIGSTTDNSDGTYTASFIANAQGSTTVGANIAQSYSVTVTPTLTVEKVYIAVSVGPGPATSISVNSGNNVTLRATLKNSSGTTVTGTGYIVSFATSSGTSTVNTGTASEVSTGVYEATYQGVLAGTPLTVSAATTIPHTVNNTASLQVIPGTVISAVNSNLTTSANTVRSGLSVQLTATLKDAAGNLIPGLSGVSFGKTTGGGIGTGTFSATVDAGNGVYTTNFTGVTPGTATTITSSHGGVTVGASVGVSVTAGSPTKLTVAGPTTINVNTCTTAYRLDFFDSNDNVTTLASSTHFTFGGQGNAKFFSDSGCTTPISQLSVVSNQSSSQDFYLKTYDPANMALTFTAAGISQAPSTYAVTVNTAMNWLGLGMTTDFNQASNSYYGFGRYDGTFQTPFGVVVATVNSVDYLFVSDNTNHAIFKYRISDGAFMGAIGRIAGFLGAVPTVGPAACTAPSLTINSSTTTWCKGASFQSGSGDGAFNNPQGMTYLNGYLYVADNGNHRIVKIDADNGQWVGYSGKFNASPGSGICSGQTGTTSTWCIGGNGTTTASAQIATSPGNYYGASGSTGTGAGGGNEFRNPQWLSNDGTNLYVGDVTNNRLVKLDPSNGRLLAWMGWVQNNTGLTCTSTNAHAGVATNALATAFTDSWCTGGASTSAAPAQYSSGTSPNIGWQTVRNTVFYNDGTNDFMYTFDTGSGRLIRYLRTTGAYRGWTGRSSWGPGNIATPGGLASIMTGVCSTSTNSYTQGWCYGGSGQGAGAIHGLTNAYTGVVNGSNLYIVNSAGPNVFKMDLASGVLNTWVGRVSSTPSGGAANCSTTASGGVTPGWCIGGFWTHGYAQGHFSRINSSGNGADGLYSIATDGTKMFTADAQNYRVQVHDLSSGQSTGSIGGRVSDIPSTWQLNWGSLTPTYTFLPHSYVLNRDPILYQPYGVSIASGTTMYVADSSLHRIKKYNWDTGEFLGWIGIMATLSPTGGDADCVGAITGGMTPGWCKGGGSTSGSTTGFNNPRDMVAGTVSGENTLIVADNSNHRLVRIRESDGLFLGWMGGVAAGGSPSDSLYNVSGCQSANSASTPNTTPHFCLGGASAASNNVNGFSSPRGIDGFIDTDDGNSPNHYYVIVADSGNARIQKINVTTGQSVGWVGRINAASACGAVGAMTTGWCTTSTVNGSNTTGNVNNGYMTTPSGVWIDKSASPIVVYVADSGNGKILKFNASTGAFLGWVGRISNLTGHGCTEGPTVNTGTKSWCTGGQMAANTGNGEYSAPHSITGDATYLYVTDVNTHRVNRIDKSSGMFKGWKGAVLTAPADSASYPNTAACLGLSPGDITPDWCFGGTSQSGYKFSTNSMAAGMDQPRGIQSRGNYLIIVDSNNNRLLEMPK